MQRKKPRREISRGTPSSKRQLQAEQRPYGERLSRGDFATSGAQQLGTPAPGRGQLESDIQKERYLASCINAAIAPLRAYMNSKQVELVRSIVYAHIAADPVSHRLIANALRAHFRFGAASDSGASQAKRS